MTLTPDGRKLRAADAKQLLGNPLLKAAFAAVGAFVDDQAMSCPPDDAPRAQRIIISKQLLAAIVRELTRHVEDGEVAAIQIAEIERTKRGMFRR